MATLSDAKSVTADRGELIPRQEERVLVLDFGGQTAQLIARRIRDANVFCQLVRHDLSARRIRELAPRGLILSGGPASVYESKAPEPDPAIFELGIPILGICYGMHAACRVQGSRVTAGAVREFGRTTCRVREPNGLFAGLPDQIAVWMSHGDQVDDLSDDFRIAGGDRHVPLCRGPAPHQADLRPAVPSRGDAHRARRRAFWAISSARSAAARERGGSAR